MARLLLLSVLLAPLLAAQEAALRFDVASIRLNKSETGLIGGGCRGLDTRERPGGISALMQAAKATSAVRTAPLGRCVFTRTSLDMLIDWAYGVRTGGRVDKKISGGPSWLSSEHYDIEAVAPDPAKVTEAQLYAMLRTLLEDRFQLKLHRESRETQGFELVVGKGGGKLERATGKEDRQGLASIVGQPLTGRNATMAALANFLGGRLSRPVADETGLPGGYNFTLKWTPSDDERSFGANLPGGVQLPPEVRAQMAALSKNDSNGPSLYTALQEQLGLKLNPKALPVEVFVIDSAQKPSEN